MPLDLQPERWKIKPYAHQVVGVRLLVEHKAFGLFDEMGCGKSAQVVNSACLLAESGAIDVVLVISPAAVRSVWLNPEWGEIRKHAWLPSRALEFHSKVRLMWQDEGVRLDWVVTNYEYLRIEEHRDELLRLLHGRRILMVTDESSFIKNRRAAQTKACVAVGRQAARRVILNGTPVGNNVFDLWSQMNFLDPKILPYKNFYHFRSEFAVMGGWHDKKVIQWKNLDRLQELIAPHVIRREKKDCLDLPSKIRTKIEVPLSEATWKVYKEMRDEAVVWLGENPSMAAQAGVKVMRLSQITSGFLGGFIEPENEVMSLSVERRIAVQVPAAREIGREKLDLLRGWVTERLEEDPGRKIIVWCRFRPELERVAADLADMLPTYRLYGQGRKERAEAVDRFSKIEDKNPALLAGQVQAGGFGLNLIAADVVVYLSNDFSLLTRLQSEDRVHRPGQTKHVVYLDVLATGPKGQKTIDAHISKALQEKEDIATWTCAAWKQALTEE